MTLTHVNLEIGCWGSGSNRQLNFLVVSGWKENRNGSEGPGYDNGVVPSSDVSENKRRRQPNQTYSRDDLYKISFT